MNKCALFFRASRLRLRPHIMAALLAGAAGSACSLAPVYQRPPLPVAAAYPTGAAYAQARQDAARAQAAADIGWRDFLTDPRLQRLVEIGLANNRDLRIAALNVARLQGQYRIQEADLLPQIDAMATALRSRTPAAVSTTGHAVEQRAVMVGGTVSWELDFFGRLANLSQVALQQYLSTAQARKAAQLLLVAQIADQYITLLGDDELVAVTQRTLASAQASYQLTLLQLDTGTGTQLALREAQTVVESAKANYAAQIRDRAQAQNALTLLVGQPVPAEIEAPIPLNSQQIIADIPQGLPADLLMRRPDIMQAEAVLRGANANIGAARAAFFPRIDLTGDLGNASPALGGLFQSGSKAWSFTPSIVIPIFNGGALEADLDVARVEQEISVAQYEKSIQTAFREVADGLAARGTYDDQLAAMQRYTQAQQSRLDLSNLRYQSGVDPYLSVLTAQTDLYNAQQTLVGVRVAQLRSRVDLYRALGGGWLARTGEVPRAPEDIAQAPRAN